MEGKVLIIKSVLIPTMLFLSYVFPAQDRVLRRVIKCCLFLLGIKIGEI